MNQSEEQQEKSAKKGMHPVVWLCLGIAIYAILQAWVFPKMGVSL